MQEVVAMRENLVPRSIATSRVAAARIGIGLLQGLTLYYLYSIAEINQWPAGDAMVFGPLFLAILFVPVLLVSGLGHLESRRMTLWVLVGALTVALLGIYDVWRPGNLREWHATGGTPAGYPSPLITFVLGCGLYITHALILAGATDKRWIAHYPTYFETAWKLAIQIKFSALFVGALWLVLWLGATLFMLINLDFLSELLVEPWFAIPLTAIGFASAMHITDVRPAIVRGIRSLLLVLLSWVLPVTTLIVGGFLLSLPWTGLTSLWATRSATSVLLGTAGVLVILINAAFQNGIIVPSIPRLVRVCVRLASLMLAPLVVIAIYALSLRVNEYGWTTPRIIAAACLVTAGCYAVGYAWATCRNAGSMATVANVNVIAAFAIILMLLGLFSPIADPARLSVNSQLERLETGAASAAEFDFDYLRFDGARYGEEALTRLKTHIRGSEAPFIRRQAELTLNKTHRWDVKPVPAPAAPLLTKATDIDSNIAVWPDTERLPDSFLRQQWNDSGLRPELPKCLFEHNKKCDAYLIDFNEDNTAEILLVGAESRTGAAVMRENADGQWQIEALLPQAVAGCVPLRQRLRNGDFQLVMPRVKDIEIAGQRIEVQEHPVSNPVLCSG